MEVSDENKERDEDTLCGVLGYHPKWLQFFASKKTYCILFGLVGMNQLAISSYVIATITTIEKRFKMPSQASGVILSGWDIGTIFSSITMAYIGSQGHKTRWVALGTLLVSFACYSQLVSYYVYGAGADAKNIASQNSTQLLLSSSSCGRGALYKGDCEEGSVLPQVLMFSSQFLLGVGTSMYWTLGIAYLDDNVRKNKVPMLLAISSTIRLLGGPIGFTVAAKSLQQFADPWLSPTITDEDPRWIGAWWIGWIPFGIIATIFSFLLTLFPRVLPRAAIRNKKMKASTDSNVKKRTDGVKLQGFYDMLKRLFKNPLLMCNTFGYVFYMFGVNGYWTYMPKYMETQFRLTASNANYYTGVVELVSAALGVMLSGVVVTKLRPSGRRIALCNLIVEVIGVICVLVNAQLGCHGEHIAGHWQHDRSFNLTSECNMGCKCGPDVPYEPVCHVESSTTFFSPCHAGCSLPPEFLNGTKIFPNCAFDSDSACEVTANLVDSICPAECSVYLNTFLVIFWIQNFLSSFSHSALVIIQFRTVAPEDKSVSIALSEMMCSLITYIPSPIFYGHLIDKACMVWGSTCGESGNCWLYYGQTLRYYFNYVAAVFLTIALVFDFGIWKYSKGLELYEEEEADDDSCEEKISTKSQLIETSGGENIALKAVGT